MPDTKISNLQILGQQIANPSNEFRLYNKLENNFHLSNKCALFYNMKRYYEAIGRDPFEVIPLTFHIKKNTEDPEFFRFMKVFKDVEVENQAYAAGVIS